MFRPKDWKNPNSCENGNHLLPGEDKYCFEAFEAGADAMLEGLRKDGSDIPEGLTNRKGKLVFIPDEETNA